jgi:hypothetical protein
MFHGGGRFGSKEHLQTRATALAAQGFTAIAVQCRLLDLAPWPGPVADAAAGDLPQFSWGWLRARRRGC